MPVRPTKNVATLYVEIDPGIAGRLAAFTAARGETRRKVVEQALARHMDHPPPVQPPPPLPALPPVGVKEFPELTPETPAAYPESPGNLDAATEAGTAGRSGGTVSIDLGTPPRSHRK